jgi:hypothetical protein
MNYWSALDLLKQVVSELGLEPSTSINDGSKQMLQMTALLNAGGNELMTFYAWEQFIKFFAFDTVAAQDEYPMPDDWNYFIDQTQWDQTNHWPLLGPKSPQEWAWLKGGLLQAAPRMRYRVYQNNFVLHPVPGSSSFHMNMEYITNNWVNIDATPAKMVTQDGDIIAFNPWLISRFVKLKFYELKGFDTTGVRNDFLRIFQSLTGKDKGAPKLSLSPRFPPLFIGPWSIPDGSWDVNPGMSP